MPCYQMLLLGLLALAATSQSVSAARPQQGLQFYEGPVVITGQIKNPTHDTIELTLLELCGRVRHTTQVDDEGRFCFEIDVMSAHNNYLRYGRTGASLYFAPNDKLHFIADSADMPGTIEFSGDHAEINRCMSRYYVEFQLVKKAVKHDERKKQLRPDEFIQHVAQFRKRVHGKIDEIIATVDTNAKDSAEIEEWLSDNVKYWCAVELVEYGQQHQHEFPKSYESLFDEDDPPNASLLRCSLYYRGFLQKYHIDRKLAAADGFDHLQQQLREQSEAGVVALIDFVDKNVPHRLAKNLFLTRFCRRFADSDHAAVEAAFDTYAQVVNDPTCRNCLLRKLDEVRNERPIISTLDDLASLDEVGELFQDIRKKAAGKVLYIDVWGTWCGNCIAQIPHSIRLHESLVGRDVEFVYLCVESPEADYKAFREKHPLKGLHYWLTDEQTEAFQASLKSRSMPHYLIVGKDGRIVDEHAKRPSSSVLLTELIELTDE